MPETYAPVRLPADMRAAGGQVAVALPLEDHSVAHRANLTWEDVKTGRGRTGKEVVVRPRCRAGVAGVKWAAFSAGWADHLGAHACPRCFGE